jgi:hypothetical protein
VPYNLLPYSQNFSNANWVKLNSTILSSNNLAPDGTLTAARLNMPSGSSSQLFNGFPSVAGSYTTSIWVRLVSGSGNFKLGFYDNVTFLTDTITVTSTWQRFSVTKTLASAVGARGCWLYSDETNQVVEVFGGQVVEGTQPLTYQPNTTRLNIPRIDYSSGSCPSLLLEPQRTNICTDSETYSVNWGSTFTSITKNLLAPSGQTTASTMVNNIGTNISIFKLISVVSGNTYKWTFYIKKISGSWTSENGLRLSSWGAAVASQTYTNIGTTVTTDWVRYTHTFTATSTGNVYCQLISNEVHTFGLWGSQLEAGAYATSYIPTTTASVTRNYDFIFLGNNFTSGRITSSGGTWFTHLINNVPRTRDSGGGVGLRLSNVAFNNTLHISTPSGSNQRYWIRKIVGGTNTDLYSTLNNEIKVAIKWNGTTADVFVNGVKVVSATAFTSVDLENLGLDNGNIPYNINSMALWPTPLTDTQLAQLTTI